MTTMVNGKKYAQDLQQELLQRMQTLSKTLSLHIVYVGRDSVIDNFINYKKRLGDALGVDVVVHHFDDNETEGNIIKQIQEMAAIADGIIVQLPLPEGLETKKILDAVPALKDIDVLSSSARKAFSQGTTPCFPPVTGAIEYIFRKNNVSLDNKNIVIVGNGSLVGYPTGLWLAREGYPFDSVDKNTPLKKRNELFKNADIIISGAGVPNLILPEMLSGGVVLVDAGTSESGKKLVGDIHPDCVQVSSLFTPVPGGVGPLTISILYANLVLLYEQNSHE